MTIVTLIRIDPQDAAGGPMVLRLSSHDRPDACHLGGGEWDPALASLPDFALDFFGGAFAGQITAPRTSFSVATTGIDVFAAAPAARARFADAQVRIWVGDITSTVPSDLGPLTLRFDGRITAEPQIDNVARIATFEAAVKDSWADEPLLALFAGTGGIEGPADLTGQPKPLVLGNVRFAGGTLIDRVDNVWMVSDGPIQGVSAAYDRLTSLGPSAGNYADLAALKAASIPNGSWGTCLAQGLVRFGAPPDGRVSFDVQGSNAGTGGYVRRPGAIIRRIAERKGGTVNAASLTALDSARPYNLQLQLREQVTAREVIQQIADSVAAVAGVSLTGQLFAQPLAIGTPIEVIAADDSSALRVASVEEQAMASPAWKLATEAEPTFEVHSADEAAFEYRWQGEYSAARVYRMDDVVTGPDSAAWAYINAVPAAGQALPVWPVTSNAHWDLFQAPGGAGISVVDGELIGIATPPVFVDNELQVVRGTLSSLPATGDFDGQMFQAIDTGEVLMWNGPALVWINAADITEEQPIVGLLDPDTGRATSRRINSQIMASGVLQLLDVNPITATTDGSGVATISIAAHQVFDDVGTLSFSAASIGGLAASTTYYVYENNPGFVGGARSYVATTDRTALATFGRRFVGFVTTPGTGAPPNNGGGGGGAGGWPGSEIP